MLARKWESALLVNVDNDTLRRVLDSPEGLTHIGGYNTVIAVE